MKLRCKRPLGRLGFSKPVGTGPAVLTHRRPILFTTSKRFIECHGIDIDLLCDVTAFLQGSSPSTSVLCLHKTFD